MYQYYSQNRYLGQRFSSSFSPISKEKIVNKAESKQLSALYDELLIPYVMNKSFIQHQLQ